MSAKRRFLICYDVVDNKRLRNVHKLLCDVALPVQYSVFEAELNNVELSQLQEALLQQIDLAEDKLTIYRLFKKQPKLDLGNKLEENEVIFI